MSRAYVIKVSESQQRVVHVDDAVRTQLELLPILDAGTMAQLLAAELHALGFEDAEEGVLQRSDEDGVEIRVDLREGNAGSVELRLTGDQALSLRATRRRAYNVPDEDGSREDALRKVLESDLDAQAEQGRAALQREVTEALEGRLRDLRATLDGAVNRASAAALKERAARLGRITELSEDPETGSLTIKVEV